MILSASNLRFETSSFSLKNSPPVTTQICSWKRRSLKANKRRMKSVKLPCAYLVCSNPANWMIGTKTFDFRMSGEATSGNKVICWIVKGPSFLLVLSVSVFMMRNPVGFSKYVPTSSQAMTPFSPPYHFNHIASLISVCFRLVSFPADR